MLPTYISSFEMDFLIKAHNDKKECSVAFHAEMTFSNGVFRVHWGARTVLKEIKLMIIRNSALILLTTLLVVRACYCSNVERNNYCVEFSACKHEPRIIGMALKQLSSGDYNQTLHARNTLLKIANESSACKHTIIRALMVAMDQPNLDFERQATDYYIWREGSQLLGELKAVEALDLLISHLDMTNGFHSSSMAFQPAILGVRQMGHAAVPKLALALKEHAKPSIRLAAGYCLTAIGGVAAMNALRSAQESESNSCVANFIRVSLETFSYKTKSGVSFDNKAPQANSDGQRSWLMAFQCVE